MGRSIIHGLSSAQMIIGVLLLASFNFVAWLCVNAIRGEANKDAATIGLLTGLSMALSGSIGAMVNAVFRSNSADMRTAASLETLAANQNSPPPPALAPTGTSE